MVIIYNGSKATGQSIGRQLDGEKIPGDLNSWDYYGTDPNEILKLSYKKLSQRSTTLYHTHPPVCSAINKTTAYAVGSGLIFRSQPDWEILGMTKEAAKDWGMRFQKLIHYMSLLMNFYAKQEILFRTGLIMGDSLLFFDRVDSGDLPFDLIETGGDQINFQATGGENEQVTLGILHDKYYRRKGIYLEDAKQATSYIDDNGDQNVIQYFDKLLARQLRGLPLAYRIISSAKNNDRFWDATLHRAVMETIFLGYTESSGDDPRKQMEFLADTMKADATGTTTETVTSEGNATDMGPGSILSFNKGGGIKFTDLKTPSNNFDKMQAAYIDLIGMATDVPPEVILSRYSTSYTAHKGAFNDFIKMYKQKRDKFCKIVMKPTIREMAKYLFFEKLIEMPHPDFFKNPIIREAVLSGIFLGPVPGHINPQQEAMAKETEVKNAFRLRSDAAADYGSEFDNMIEEWIQEETEWRKISPVNQANIISNEMNDNENKSDNENSEEDKEDEDNLSQR